MDSSLLHPVLEVPCELAAPARLLELVHLSLQEVLIEEVKEAQEGCTW